MKKLTGLYVCALMTMAICLAVMVSAGPAFSAEPDEEKLLNRLKGELAEEGSLLDKVLGRFNFGLLIEAGVVYRDENVDDEDESDIDGHTLLVLLKALTNLLGVTIDFSDNDGD